MRLENRPLIMKAYQHGLISDPISRVTTAKTDAAKTALTFMCDKEQSNDADNE